MQRIFEMPEFAGSFALLQVIADKGLAEAGLELDSLTSNNINELAKTLAGSSAKNGAVSPTGVQADFRLLLLIKFWDKFPDSTKDEFLERLLPFLPPE